MTHIRLTRSLRQGLARLGAALLALAILLPGQPLNAAALPQGAAPTLLQRPPAAPAVNHNPVAGDDNLAAFENEDFQTLYLLDNDTDLDLDPLTIYSVTVPAHGQIYRPNDFLEVEYTPNPGFHGVDHFTYRVIDGHGGQDFGAVTVTVAATGDTGLASGFALSACLPDPSGCPSSIWKISPYAGATGNTSSGACNGSAGLGVDDVRLLSEERTQAFDTGLTFWVNGVQFKPKLPMTVTEYSLVTGPVTMSNVRVTVHFDGLKNSDTLRTDVMLSNATGADHTITFTVASNLGSNNHTTIYGSSSGDTTFTTADRWLVTGNANLLTQGGLVDTHVLFGSGSPTVTASAVYNTTFTCGETPTPNSQGVRADFHVTIPHNSTRRLLFFNQVHNADDEALADAAVFNGEPVAFLDGLTNANLAQVVNWNLLPVLKVFLPLTRR